MDATATIVLIAGSAAIVLVLWYFFGPRKAVRATANAGIQEVNITVKGGYSPDLVVVEKDKPVRLNFYRDETDSCSAQLILGEFGIARDLPAFKTTAVEFTPRKAGEFLFSCGMNMLRGKLVVKAAPVA